MISREARARVRIRAEYRCEYCRLNEHHSPLPFHIEHVVAQQHGGPDDEDNLAFACHRCNLHKGPNLTGIDPHGGEIAALFHPRKERWLDHFGLDGAQIVGKTSTGRTTVQLLTMNDERRVDLRNVILSRGQYL